MRNEDRVGEKGNIYLDIIIVTYNSREWISRCLNSILESKYDMKNVSLIIVDNQSIDKIEEAVTPFKDRFGSFKLIINDKNIGFGRANNIGVSHSISDYILLLNPDTEIHEDAIKELVLCSKRDDKNVALWELRQFPYEHPKYYNPITMLTSWSSAAACMIQKSAFLAVKGFDENIYLYCEDVDLSWRLRLEGYKLKYVPKAIVYHYTYKSANEIKPIQFYNSIKNNLLLRYKFGSIIDIIKGYKNLLYLFFNKEIFLGSRTLLLKIAISHFLGAPTYLYWNIINIKKIKKLNIQFLDWDYEIHRPGAFYVNELPRIDPLVSIIIRTIGRPHILREAITSIKNQTYENIEIILVEDGPNRSEEIIVNEFKDLNIKYFFTGDKVGRCRAGNIGLQRAKGKYLGFLDDDDVFYPEHIEVLINNLEKNNKSLLAYSISFETPIMVKSINPYVYEELSYDVVYRQAFNRLLLFYNNYIPIQNILFDRSLYEDMGGFDEDLDLLEDWDLWIRYSTKTDFVFVNKLTSIYRVPGNIKDIESRNQKLSNALDPHRKKHKGLNYTCDVYSSALDVERILDIYIHDVYPIRISKESLRRIHFGWCLPKCIKVLGKLIKK